jgi:hypothetical protein|tara:strand:- start:131 stop:577 length:447 start_codon:yes stop_codon:yes gene_type:complete
MRRLTSKDLKELNLLKHYRIIRKWACKTTGLNDADLELLIYLDAIEHFTKDDFKKGTYSYSWDNRRWNRLLKQGWIVVWRERNRTTQKYHIYKVSYKCKQLISRMYRIMLGEEDMPTKVLESNNKYSWKVTAKAIAFANRDKTRTNAI